MTTHNLSHGKQHAECTATCFTPSIGLLTCQLGHAYDTYSMYCLRKLTLFTKCHAE